MLEEIKTYKKGKNGKFILVEKSLSKAKVDKKAANKIIEPKKKKFEIKSKKVKRTYENDDDYISYDEILRQLKKQKNNSNNINIFQDKIVKTKALPVNKNKFIIHQYSYEDKRNKIHKELQNQLAQLVKNGSLTHHVLLYGLSGSGKYTLGMYILHHIYGGSTHDRYVKTQTVNKREIKYIENSNYIELLINNYVINDNNSLGQFINNNTRNKRTGVCQYIIIKHFDELTPACQKTIYHIMERHSHLRFILTTKHLCNIIPNIISMVTKVRVPRPDAKLLAKYMNRIAKSNDINITHNQIEYIVRSTECNISQALTTMELSVHNNSYVKTKDSHTKYIAHILQESTGPGIGNIRAIRELVSTLVKSTYDSSEVYKTCVKLFLNSKYDMDIKQQVIELGNKYSQLNNTTHNTIFIMEAFFLHVMRIINDMPGKKTYSLQKISKKS